MALDVALVLRLVNRLSSPIKEPIRDVRQLGNVAENAQSAMDRFSANGAAARFGNIGRSARNAASPVLSLGDTAEESASRIASIRSDIEHFRSLKTEVTNTQTRLKDAQSRASEFGRTLKIARSGDVGNADIQKLERQFEGAARAAKRFKEQSAAQRRTLDMLRGSLRSAGINTKDLARATRELNKADRDNTEALRQRAQMQDRLQRRRARVGRIQEISERHQNRRSQLRGSAMETAALGYGAFRFMQSAGQNQSTLTDIGITGGLSLAERKALKGQVDQVSDASMQKRGGIYETMEALVAFGIDKDVAQASLLPIARTATAGKAAMPDVGQSAISLIENLKIPVERLENALEMQAKGADLGGFELRDMAAQFPTITAAAAGQNISGEGGLASLVAASQIARTASSSGSGAATLVTNLLDKIDAPDTVSNFEEFDIDLISRLQDFDAAGVNRLDAIISLTNEAITESGARFAELFGDKETRRMITKLVQEQEKYKSLKSEITNNSAGTVEAMFDDRVGNDATIKWSKFGDDLGAMRDKIAMPLLPIMSDLMTSAGPVIERFGQWAADNPELIASGAKLILVLAGLKLAVLGVGFAASSIAGPIMLGWMALTRFGIGSAWLGTKVAGSLPLLNRLGYGFGMLIGRALNLAFGLSTIAKALGGLGRFSLRWASIIPMLTWRKFIKPIGWRLLGGPLRWGALIGGFVWSRFLPKIAWGAAAGKLGWGTLITALKWGSRLIPVISWATLLLPLAWEYIIKPLGWDKYLPKIEWNGWIPKITWPDWFSFKWADLLPDWNWSKIIKPFPKLNLPSWLGGSQSAELHGPPLPVDLPTRKIDGARASGGPVKAGGTYLVGERGPELLQMGNHAGTVIPSALSMALLSAPVAALAAPNIGSAGNDIKIAAPSQRSAPSRSAGSVHVQLKVASGAITIQTGSNAAPQEIGRAALDALVSQAAPLLRRELENASNGGSDLTDAPELFE